MPSVEVEEHIGAPVEAVWKLVNDVEAFPDLMEHVHSIEVVERGERHRVTAWQAELKGCLMRWVEREEIDPDRYRLEFRQVEGDMAELAGFWSLEPVADGTTRVTLSVRFDVGIPGVSEMLDPVVESAIRDNSRAMLASIASRATAATVA